MDGIILDHADMAALRDHAIRCAPEEACGMLLGVIKDTTWLVLCVVPARNTAHSPVRFTMHEDDILAVYKRASEQDMDVVGVFHSHPSSGAVPSATDKTYMRLNPVAWLIYSGIYDECRAWKLDGDKTREIRLAVCGHAMS